MDSLDFSASLALGLAFAKDLKRSPAVLFLGGFVFEFDRFRLGAWPGWSVDRPDVFASEPLPLRAGPEASSVLAAAVAGVGLMIASASAFGAPGLYLVIRR